MGMWLRAFALTLACELPVAGALLRGVAPGRRLGLIFFANLASHPVVWFVLPALPLPYFAWVVLSELWAWLSEALLYHLALPALPARRPVLVSLAANGASLGAGL